MLARFRPRLPRAVPSLAVLGVVLAAGSTALLAACNGTTTIEEAPPITGVRVDATALFGPTGCGTGAGSISKFAATLSSRTYTAAAVDAADQTPISNPPVFISGSTFDCFADGTFLGVRLTAHYQIRVFGYSQAAFAANPDIAGALRVSNVDDRENMLRPGASVIATCDADQHEDIVSTATCVVELDTRAGSDAGPDDAGPDAGTGTEDAGTDASTEASDAEPADAGDAANDATTADAGDD